MTVGTIDLSGKLVLVTGAGTGIGRGIALAAARAGADVVLHYASSAVGAQSAVAEIAALGRRACALQADLCSTVDCCRLVDQAAAFLGGLDGIVNCAGLTLNKPFLAVTPDDFEDLYALNIRGQYFVAQQAVRHIVERGRALRAAGGPAWAGGSIVNISSVHGLVGKVGHSLYAGTKGAINAFSRELAVELIPEHIRVNVIAPGTIEVPRYLEQNPAYTSALGGSWVPWGRVGQPDDVGHLAVYLLSDASEFMTGQVLCLDGGLTAKMAFPQ
jgi:NAD(P)-dependent dehydrogenase (short-subunit alcohol dehydrogenase family)